MPEPKPTNLNRRTIMTKKSVVSTTPEIRAAQSEWLRAKEAENQWRDYRLAQEKIVMEGLNHLYPDHVKAYLNEDHPASGSWTLDGGVTIAFGVDRKLNQTRIGSLVANRPDLIGTTFSVTYKADKRTIDGLVAAHDDLGKYLETCFEDKPKKVAFSVDKS